MGKRVKTKRKMKGGIFGLCTGRNCISVAAPKAPHENEVHQFQPVRPAPLPPRPLPLPFKFIEGHAPTYVEGSNFKRIMFKTGEFSLEIGIDDCITFKKHGSARKGDDTIYTAKVTELNSPIKTIIVKLYDSDTHTWSNSIEGIPLPNNDKFGNSGSGIYNTIVKLDKCPSALLNSIKVNTTTSGGKQIQKKRRAHRSKRKTHRKRR